eukprot:CCRYP_011318-RA/>CCRYP_011318-RA protein AED:0.07 eAED:0.07 QI:103/1/1/1/1/1/2/230/1260
MSIELSVDYSWNGQEEEKYWSTSMSMTKSNGVALSMSDGDDSLWKVDMSAPSATPTVNERFDWAVDGLSFSLSMSASDVLLSSFELMSIPGPSMSMASEDYYYLWNDEETGVPQSSSIEEQPTEDEFAWATNDNTADLSLSMSMPVSTLSMPKLMNMASLSMPILEDVSENEYLWSAETNVPSSSSTVAATENRDHFYWATPGEDGMSLSFSVLEIMVSNPELSLSMPGAMSLHGQEDFDWVTSDTPEYLSFSMSIPDSSITESTSIPESNMSTVSNDEYVWNSEMESKGPSSSSTGASTDEEEDDMLLLLYIPEDALGTTELSLSVPTALDDNREDIDWTTSFLPDEISLSMSVPEILSGSPDKEVFDQDDHLWDTDIANATSYPSSSITEWATQEATSFSLSMSHVLIMPEFSVSMPNLMMSTEKTEYDDEYLWNVEEDPLPSASATGASSAQDFSWVTSGVEEMSLSLPMTGLSFSTPEISLSMEIENLPSADDCTLSTTEADSPSPSPTKRPILLGIASPTTSTLFTPTYVPSSNRSVEPSVSPTLLRTARPSQPLTGTPSAVISFMPSISSSPTVISTSPPSQSTLPSLTHSSAPSTSGLPTLSSSLVPSTSIEPTSTHSASPSTSTEPTIIRSSSPSRSTSPTFTNSMVPSISGGPTVSPTQTPSATPTVSSSSMPSSSHSPTTASPVIDLEMYTPSDRPTDASISSPTPSFLPTSPVPTTLSGKSAKTVDSKTSNPTRKPSQELHPVLLPTPLPSALGTSNGKEYMMTSFSTNATILFDDLSEPMDKETTIVFEQVVTGFLIDATLMNDDQSHQVFISSVDVIDQKVIEVDGNQGTKERHGRSLTTKALQVVIHVVGEVEPEAPDSYIVNVTTMLQDQLDDEGGRQELATRLAKESTYFDSYYSQQNELVFSEAQKGATEDKVTGNRWIVLIVGGCVAVAALVGSIFYMERRFNNATGRRAIRRDGFELFHLRHASADEMEKDMLGRIGTGQPNMSALASPKSVNESRMKSVLDFDDEKSSVLNSEVPSQPNEENRESLNLSLDQLKEAVKKRDSNIFIFTDDKRSSTIANGDESLLELKATVSSLSNPSQVDELVSPSPRFRYLPGDAFDYHNAEKLIGDQFDARAILTPYTPRVGKGDGPRTPRTRTVYSFGSPISALSRKDKLFDVNAPPGPLGIIIDTTPDGPMIHSLKPTSQLLGLVNPGDLIVGLDGVDTRNMTAATFTRLMAKRSQGERKITLLKGLAPLTPRTPR